MATSANGVPALSLSTISVVLASRRLPISSSRQRASTLALTSSRVRSRDGVMPSTSNQTKPPPGIVSGSFSAPVSARNASLRMSTPFGRPATGWSAGERPARSTASIVATGRLSFFAMSASLVPFAYSSSILSRILLTSPLARSTAISCLMSAATSSNGLVEPGLDLDDPHDGVGEAPLDRAAHAARGKGEGRVGDGRVDHLGLGDVAEVDVLVGELALRDDHVEARAVGDLLRRGLGLRRVGEGDLLDLPAFRHRVAVDPDVVGALGVLVAHLDGLGELFRRHRDHDELAVFRRPERHLVGIVIGGQLLRRRHRNVAELVAVEGDEFDAALLVLVAVEQGGRGLGRRELAGHGAGDLAAQRIAALLAHEARLGIAGAAGSAAGSGSRRTRR